jgi:hypothetical protein
MTAPAINLVPFDKIQLGTEPRYLVKGLIPRVGLTVAWGPPKSGKSFWTFDLVMHVALGREYHGRRVQKGPVVYCAFEGASGVKARVEAFRQNCMAEDHGPVDFFLVPVTLDLVRDHQRLIAAIRATLPGRAPAAVTLDTLNRSLKGSESSDEDMSAYVRAADAIREAFECAVIIVHHCGVDGTRPRGHTSLTGAVEAQLAVRRDQACNIIVKVEWMKDGPEGEEVVSSLKVVDVGQDSDGEPITSCVVQPSDAAVVPQTRPGKRLNDKHKLALNALTECLLTASQPAPVAFQLPAGIRVTAVDRWRDELRSSGVIDQEAANPREDFRRIKNALKARNLLGERDGLIWSASTPA